MKPQGPESKNAFSSTKSLLYAAGGISLRPPEVNLSHQKLANLISSFEMGVYHIQGL